METVAHFIFLGSKITADGDCSHKIKTLAPWKRSYYKPRQYIKKHIKEILLCCKGLYSQSHGFFPVVMYKCESWTMKKAEHRGIDVFELWCWRRFLRVPWTAKRSNRSILKEINPEYSLEDLTLNWSSNTLATWCEESTHWKRPWCWERLKAGGEADDRGWDGLMASLTQWTEFEQTLGDGEGQRSLVCWSSWGCKVGPDLVTEQQQQFMLSL